MFIKYKIIANNEVISYAINLKVALWCQQFHEYYKGEVSYIVPMEDEEWNRDLDLEDKTNNSHQ